MKKSIKKFVALLLTLVVMLPVGALCVSADTTPTTTPTYTANENWGPNENGVFEISSAEDLLAFTKLGGLKDRKYGYYKDKTVVLTADIDLNPGWDASSKTEAPNKWTPLWWFYGTFDGQGHTIKGIYCSRENGASFIDGGRSTHIKNLSVENSYFTSKTDTGFVSKVKWWTTFENVYIDAIFEATEGGAGGFVARYVGRGGTGDTSSESSPGAKFESCVFAGEVKAATFAGGILGSNNKTAYGSATNTAGYGKGTFAATLTDCANYGKISGDDSLTAGLIGDCANVTTINRCYNAGSAYTALVNANISSLENEDKVPVVVTVKDSYNLTSASAQGITVSQGERAPTVNIAYIGVTSDTAITEITAATVAELVEKAGFKKTDTILGWVADADTTVAMPLVLMEHVNGHDYTDNTVAVSCATEGYTEHTCKNCGYSYKDNVQQKLPHVEGEEWIIDKEATADYAGSRHKACVNCGTSVKQEVIPKLKAEAADPADTNDTGADNAETNAADSEEKGGCGSSVTLSSALVVGAVLTLGATVSRKKRK